MLHTPLWGRAVPASVPRRGHLPCIAAQINPTNHHTATHSHTQPHTATHKSTHSHTQPHTATHKTTRIGGAHSRSPRMCVNPQSNPRRRGSQPFAPNVCQPAKQPALAGLAAARPECVSSLVRPAHRGCWWQRGLHRDCIGRRRFVSARSRSPFLSRVAAPPFVSSWLLVAAFS